ncbi:hypothetical protein [Clostridium sp. JS66]|uniref:hypothetical protein n=1 Tax=Clostridium sp. JS66 TaxID=3064705 RepID=UPI00298D89B6|nr:hypothetical protein [Clostridium sp. JS66]WPC40565.1 hypothetical protein Q6H37_22080 [Clostridium sp. JS66]
MNDKIKVEIFGLKYKELPQGCGCSHKNSSCSGCGSGENKNCGGCSGGGCTKTAEDKKTKNIGEVFEELKEFINDSDVKDNVELEFIDLDKIDIEKKYERVYETINNGFEPPITVIDNIIRYYGGVSAALIYKDVKELLE